MKRVLMFDYDGVIVDSLHCFVDVFVEACGEHGFSQIDGEEAMLRLFDMNVFEGMVDAGIPRESIGPILKSLDAKQDRLRRGCEFFDGVPEVLERLARTSRLVLITSTLTAIARDFLESHDVRCFADIVGSDREKSKVLKIQAAMADAPGCEYYYIGDTKGDVLEAREAGVRSVAAAWGWHGAGRLASASPDHMAHAPRDLVELFA